MSQDRTSLIHRALRNLGVLPQGQSPSAEEYQSIDDFIDPMIANLVERNILMRATDPDNLEDEYFLPLGHILAFAAAPEFGQADDQGLLLRKVGAEENLKEMFNRMTRDDVNHRTMRTDYYPTCGRSFNWTTGC